jgi:bifunctional DNase/RNase
VEIYDLREDVYFANLVLEVDERMIYVDSRPSDAIALASRTHAPIFVEKLVFEQAGIRPDMDLEAGEKPSEETVAKTSELPDSKDRLSVFEDFLSKLDSEDKGDKGKKPDEDDAPDPDRLNPTP